MKRNLIKLIVAVLAALMLALVGCNGCSGSNWSENDVTLKDWGAVVSSKGFIAETANYVYYVNGIGLSDEENEFGNPVKGTLMAAKKADIEAGKSSDEVEKCIVVPKLFVAADYQSGLFISGDYVYYGSPSTDKDSSGKTANTELEFYRTKLDGTDTTTYCKTGALSDEYRFVEVADTVYIVYYNSVDSKIISYNTANKTETVVAEADVTTEKTETLDKYVFADADNAADGVVYFTDSVYTGEYDEEAAKGDNYTRPTASYNKLYTYKVGDEAAKLVFDGESSKTSYAVSFVYNNYVYYTATASVGVNTAAVTYAATAAELYAANVGTRIVNAEYAISGSLIVSLNEVYVKNADSSAIRKSTLIGDKSTIEKTVATVSTVSSFLFKNGDYIYYINASNMVARIKVDNVDASDKADVTEQVVSKDTIPTDWFMPEIVGDYLYYCDNSDLGRSYVKFVSIKDDTNVVEDYDEETDTYSYTLSGHTQICKMADADLAPYVTAKITAIEKELENGKLVFDAENDANGKPTVSAITEARKLYDDLSKENKKLVIAETVTLLEKYEQALKLSQTLYKLDKFDELSADAKNALKADYDAATSAIEELKNSDYDYQAVRNLVEGNLNWYYQKAQAFFTPAE